MMLRTRVAALAAASLAVAGTAVVPPPPAAALLPAPVILNSGAQNSGNAQWMETQAQPDDGGASVKQFWATFLVRHAVGRTINQVFIQGPGVNGAVSVSGQSYVAAAGRIETSRVTVAIGLGKPGGFSCPFVGGATRSVDAGVTMRVIDNTGENSGNVSTSVKFVEDLNCNGQQDFPRMTSVSQNATEVVPGQNITYSFTCSDADTDLFSSDDDCDRANIRWRRLDDGATSAVVLKTGINDDTGTSHAMSFPSQGYYVVEAQLGNENGTFPNTGGSSQGWWRLGNAVVNDSSGSLSGSLSFSGVQPSSPPSVNAGAAATAIATVSDAGGAVQVIEWDADGNGSFERREYTVPTNSGGNIIHPALTIGELQQTVNTSIPGLKTVNVRITDNGALDAADNIRRQLTFSGQLRINAVPTASNVNTSTNEDTPRTVTLVGNDPDNQPVGLIYSIVSPPPASAGTLGAVFGNQVTFTPAPNFNGATSFTYQAADGPAPNNGAFAFSNTATVNITVQPVNDPPTVHPKSATTNEDTPVNIQSTGTDVEGPLTWSVASQPPNGSATCHPATGLCTYSPAPNFFGNDSFVVRGTDSGGLSATATFSVTVNAVNDAPVADDQSVTVAEDATNFPITLTASDVDDASLTFTAPVDDVDHGTLTCTGASCSYSPAPNYNGPDSFTFTVSDGNLGDLGLVTIDVTQVNDGPVALDVLDAQTDEDVLVTLTLGGTDVEGDPVTVTGVTDPAHGTATIVGPNAAEYMGDPNFNGTDTFEFTVTDGQGGFDTGTVKITVHPVNDGPVIEDQTFAAVEDTPLTLSLVAGDVDGDALTWAIVSPPSHGHLSGSGPDVLYSPNADFNGTDSFVVQVADGNGGVDTATVTIEVAPVNDPPVAVDTSVTVYMKSSASFTLQASDVDDDQLTFTAPVDGPSHGTMVCSGASCEYTPLRNYHGPDQFTFVVDDGKGGMGTGIVSITVKPGRPPGGPGGPPGGPGGPPDRP